jgi:hypothetical protein
MGGEFGESVWRANIDSLNTPAVKISEPFLQLPHRLNAFRSSLNQFNVAELKLDLAHFARSVGRARGEGYGAEGTKQKSVMRDVIRM